MYTLRVFTRTPAGKEYPASLANSVHFAICKDGKETVLNQNYGILFAKAKIKEDNTLDERGLFNPLVVKKDEEYYIYAEVTDKEGQPVSSDESSIIAWKTMDFVNFEEFSAIAVDPGSSESIQIPDELFPAVSERWIPLKVKSVSVPENVRVNTLEELKNIRVKAIYTDESEDLKPVYWDLASLKNIGDDTYRIRGHMKAIDTGFPLTVGLADPVIFSYEKKWYYIATNDNVNDIGLFVRRADSVEGLFTADVETKCILDYDEKRGFCQTFWAPEFHEIGGRLYILFAVSDKNWGPQCHMMRLKEGGDIMCDADWEDPIRVKRMNDHFLTEDGITLDMTYFESAGKAYLVWSYRYGIGTPEDTGSMLYIATTDPQKPWILTSEPVLLSRPLYGWENQSGTINNEGPYALISGDTVYLSYSGGDACGPAYVVGYLKAKADADLLDIASWKKEPTAVLHLQSIEGILGPGHNSFFHDADGRLMIAYHAQERDRYNCRCSAFHRVHLSASGFPLLNVAGERDLPADMSEVEMEFYMNFDFETMLERHGMDAIAVDMIGTPGSAPAAPKSGFDAIPMWVADMNFATCPAIRKAIIERAEHPAFGYFSPRDEYYRSIIDWHEKRNHMTGIRKEHIGYENGVLGGIISTLNVLCSRGDNVLLHSPTYVGFTHVLENNGYHIIHSPLIMDQHDIWRMDYEDMERRIIDKHIHTAIFCSPHNPCGRVWEPAEIEKAMKIFERHNVWVISDEIWSDILIDRHRHTPTQSVSDYARMHTAAMYAPSKTFNLAGLVGSYHIIYNDWLRDRQKKESSLCVYNEMNVLSMHALIGAYSEEGHAWVDELCRVLSENIGFACDFIRDHSWEIMLSKPEGTYMLFLRCEQWCRNHNKTIDELLKLGTDVGIAWQDGRMFNEPCGIRMNLALPHHKVVEAFERLNTYVF